MEWQQHDYCPRQHGNSQYQSLKWCLWHIHIKWKAMSQMWCCRFPTQTVTVYGDLVMNSSWCPIACSTFPSCVDKCLTIPSKTALACSGVSATKNISMLCLLSLAMPSHLPCSKQESTAPPAMTTFLIGKSFNNGLPNWTRCYLKSSTDVGGLGICSWWAHSTRLSNKQEASGNDAGWSKSISSRSCFCPSTFYVPNKSIKSFSAFADPVPCSRLAWASRASHLMASSAAKWPLSSYPVEGRQVINTSQSSW